MLKIRLARVGKRKQPTYRFVINESTRDTHGNMLEILGHYNPFTKVIEVKKDRILHWISKGAQLSPTVHNMFIDQNVITGDKVHASKGKKKNAEPEVSAATPSQPEATVVAPATEVLPVVTVPEEKAEVAPAEPASPAVEDAAMNKDK